MTLTKTVGLRVAQCGACSAGRKGTRIGSQLDSKFDYNECYRNYRGKHCLIWNHGKTALEDHYIKDLVYKWEYVKNEEEKFTTTISTQVNRKFYQNLFCTKMEKAKTIKHQQPEKKKNHSALGCGKGFLEHRVHHKPFRCRYWNAKVLLLRIP